MPAPTADRSLANHVAAAVHWAQDNPGASLDEFVERLVSLTEPDLIRLAERRGEANGIAAAISTLTTPHPTQPNVVQFVVPKGSWLDFDVLMRDVDATLRKNRITAPVAPLTVRDPIPTDGPF